MGIGQNERSDDGECGIDNKNTNQVENIEENLMKICARAERKEETHDWGTKEDFNDGSVDGKKKNEDYEEKSCVSDKKSSKKKMKKIRAVEEGTNIFDEDPGRKSYSGETSDEKPLGRINSTGKNVSSGFYKTFEIRKHKKERKKKSINVDKISDKNGKHWSEESKEIGVGQDEEYIGMKQDFEGINIPESPTI